MNALAPVKVRCANPQPTLDGPCTWTGVRAGRTFENWNGKRIWFPPTRKRCPRCGGPVKETQ